MTRTSHRYQRKMKAKGDKLLDRGDTQFENSYPLSKGLRHWKCSYCGVRHFSTNKFKKYARKFQICPCCLTKLSGVEFKNSLHAGIKMSEYQVALYEQSLKDRGITIKQVPITKEFLEARRIRREEMRAYAVLSGQRLAAWKKKHEKTT